MADRPAKKTSKKSRARKRPSPSQELMQLLGRIAANHPTARLEVDLARDAALEAFHRLHRDFTKLSHFVRRLYRARKQRTELQGRLVRLLHELSTGSVLLPRPAGRPALPHEPLLEVYRRLRGHDMPEMARTLQAAVGRKDAATYLRFLAQEVLIKGAWSLAEQLLRHGHEPFNAEREKEFMERLRHHVAGKVCQGLARKAGYQVTPEVGKQLDVVIDRSLWLLQDLLLAAPEGRLIVPRDGSAFDPARHEAAPGRPHEGALRIRATLFPGYAVVGPDARVVEKALVYTERPKTAAAPA
jgi:hypothetical protein